MQAIPAGKKLLGLGSAGVDYLASVAVFPQPDEKIRTESLEVQLNLVVYALICLHKKFMKQFISDKISNVVRLNICNTCMLHRTMANCHIALI